MGISISTGIWIYLGMIFSFFFSLNLNLYGILNYIDDFDSDFDFIPLKLMHIFEENQALGI